MVFPRGFSRPTGDSKYGDSVGGPALGLSASPVLNLNIFFAPGLRRHTAVYPFAFDIKEAGLSIGIVVFKANNCSDPATIEQQCNAQG